MIRIALRIFVVVGLLGLLLGCSPLKFLNLLTPGGSFNKTSDLKYGNDPRQRLDVFTPVNLATDMPVVVFFYGGSWSSGSRSDYSFVGEALAARGIIAVIADYRLYPQVRYQGFLEDSARAIGWTREHIRQYGGNPARLYVMGHSAGGYNAAMVALDSQWLAAVGMKPSMLSGWIGLAGAYDFLPVENPAVKPIFFFPNSPPDSQPINHVSAKSPPALLMAAKNDMVVNPARNTGGMARRLREQGVPVRELYFSKPGHGTLIAAFARPMRWLAPVLDEVVAFIHGQALATENFHD